MKSILLVLASIFTSITVSAEPVKKTVYFGVTMETSLPFIELTEINGKPEIKRGILKDLAEAVFGEMKIKPVLVLLPQKRVASELVSGDLSVVCYANESWFPNIKDELLWSEDVTTNTNYIVSVGKKKVHKIENLFGTHVGTIVNFIYKKMEPYFEKNQIYRENGPDNESNVQKLLHSRIDFLILSNLEFDYYKRIYPELESHDLHMDTLSVKCALSRKSGIDLEQLNKAIRTLKKNGILEKIFKL